MSVTNPSHRTDQTTGVSAAQQAYENACKSLSIAKANVAEYQQKLDSARNAADRVRYKDHLDRAIAEEARAQTKVDETTQALTG